MAVKYRVNGENGAYDEYLTIEEIPNGAVYETIEIVAPTETEIAESKRPLIEEIDDYYTKLISKEMQKPMEKIFRGVISEHPHDVLEKVEALRAECNEKILELGVDVSTYRKTKREVIILNKFKNEKF